MVFKEAKEKADQVIEYLKMGLYSYQILTDNKTVIFKTTDLELKEYILKEACDKGFSLLHINVKDNVLSLVFDYEY